ncbi:hypothetical protein HID58_092532 [Brassica napus]|uniref:Uncharacterized protein n=1 Tax=Brassica napus TaxID=3708 RepID=A0ABQ7WWB4_BRANA|nr:hypothetical protein HID58_092532 [Brassica napus]
MEKKEQPWEKKKETKEAASSSSRSPPQHHREGEVVSFAAVPLPNSRTRVCFNLSHSLSLLKLNTFFNLEM